jgi:thiol:disulfide interchange protein DsbA
MKISLLFVVLFPVWAHAQVEKFVEGVHYLTLKNSIATHNKEKVEVAGVFSYTCPHCANLEPVLDAWSKAQPNYVEFIHVPAVFNKNWEFYAKVFYTIDALGITAQAHQPIFNYLHNDRKALNTPEKISQFLVDNFQQEKSVVEKTLSSFGVKSKTESAKQRTIKAGVTYVPLVIIDGKYMTSVSQAKSESNFLQVMDFLVKKSQQEKG